MVSCVRKEKSFLYFRSITLYVFPCKIVNLNFENSFVTLIWLAKNQLKPNFKYWLAQSWGFFGLKLEKRIYCDFTAKMAIFWGFAIFQEVVQIYDKSPTVELWLSSRLSVFIGFQKISDLDYY